MSLTTVEKKAKLRPLISRLSIDDVNVAAAVQVNAMVSHEVHLRIQPLDQRPPLPDQIKIKAQGFRDMLAAGSHRIVKAVLNSEGDAQVAGIADWILISDKKAQVEDGVIITPAPAREQTEEEKEAAVKGVDLEIRRLVGLTSTDLRNKTMGDKKYWFFSLIAVDPAYQYRGVGQALLQWGLDQADAESLEVYLESSENGVRLYEKNGFELVGWNVLADEKSEGGSLKWRAMNRGSTSS
ncbi:hypothetical protein C8R44DRAFT_783048 [Mycena epipterygia]|nr:hypothetical protein C8R44DRAFT_783048 [Mycena epipterygia]